MFSQGHSRVILEIVAMALKRIAERITEAY